MKRIQLFLFVLIFCTALESPLSAQVYDAVRFFMDRARTATPPPSEAPRRTRQKVYRPNQEGESKANTSASDKSSRRFDGTWLATRSKTGPEGERITQIFTMIIKNGKASKTLDTTNISAAEKPFHESIYELHRKWTYDSSEIASEGASLTIQWRAGQLSDWAPKTVPTALIDSFGSPGAETSVYVMKGDDLTRINDPSGVTYRRAK